MHKLITAALLATTIASPLMAQDHPDDRGPGDNFHGRDARQHDRQPQPQPARDERHDFHGQGQPGGGPDFRRQDQPGGGYQPRPAPPPQNGGRPDFSQRGRGYDRGFAGNAPDRGPDHWQDRQDRGTAWHGADRGPDRGPPPGGWQDRHGNGGWDQHGRDQRGWDQRWRSDQRYDWRGYRDSHHDAFRVPGYYAPGGYGYRRFQPGYRIDALFYDQRYWIVDPYEYRLPPAYGPYRWVRYFDDVLLIDLRSGLIVDEIPDFFY